LENVRQTFQSIVKGQRDGIVTNLDDFVTEKVQGRLDKCRDAVSGIRGTGTTWRQNVAVSAFYAEVRSLLAKALRDHVETRVREFAEAVRTSSESVAPRIREASEGRIRDRLKAIESTLQVAAAGQKEQVGAFLQRMLGLVVNFAAEPSASTVTASERLKESRV